MRSKLGVRFRYYISGARNKSRFAFFKRTGKKRFRIRFENERGQIRLYVELLQALYDAR